MLRFERSHGRVMRSNRRCAQRVPDCACCPRVNSNVRQHHMDATMLTREAIDSIASAVFDKSDCVNRTQAERAALNVSLN